MALDPGLALAALARVESVEYHCPGCDRLIFKARALGDVEIETKCPRCSQISTALLPAVENAAT